MQNNAPVMLAFRLAMALTALVQATLAFSSLLAVVWDLPVEVMFLRAAAGWVAVLGAVGTSLYIAERRLSLRQTNSSRRDFGGPVSGTP